MSLNLRHWIQRLNYAIPADSTCTIFENPLMGVIIFGTSIHFWLYLQRLLFSILVRIISCVTRCLMARQPRIKPGKGTRCELEQRKFSFKILAIFFFPWIKMLNSVLFNMVTIIHHLQTFSFFFNFVIKCNLFGIDSIIQQIKNLHVSPHRTFCSGARSFINL